MAPKQPTSKPGPKRSGSTSKAEFPRLYDSVFIVGCTSALLPPRIVPDSSPDGRVRQVWRSLPPCRGQLLARLHPPPAPVARSALRSASPSLLVPITSISRSLAAVKAARLRVLDHWQHSRSSLRSGKSPSGPRTSPEIATYQALKVDDPHQLRILIQQPFCRLGFTSACRTGSARLTPWDRTSEGKIGRASNAWDHKPD